MKFRNSLVVLLLAVPAMAGDKNFNDRTFLPPINITNAIDNALKEHPQSLISQENVGLAKQDVRAARTDLIPGASANYALSASHNPVQLGLGNAQVGLMGVTLNQTLFNLPAIFSYKSAQERLKAASEAAEGSGLKIAGIAAASYIDVLKLRITLDLAKENYYYIQDVILAAESGDLNGKLSADDVKLAQGVLGSAMSDKHIWIQEAAISENNFNRDSRMSVENYFLLEPPTLSVPETVESAIETAIQNNPDLAAARLRVAASRQDVRAAKSTYLPRVDGYVSGYKIHRPAGDFRELDLQGHTVGVNVVVPLFDNRKGANIASQKIKKEITELQLKDQEMNLSTSLKNTYVRITQRSIRLKGLCEGLVKRLGTVESMRARLGEKVSVQDFLFQKQELMKVAISLDNEFLAQILDSYNVHIQMGTLLKNLPAPIDISIPVLPNPQLKGEGVYRNLVDRCKRDLLI